MSEFGPTRAQPRAAPIANSIRLVAALPLAGCSGMLDGILQMLADEGPNPYDHRYDFSLSDFVEPPVIGLVSRVTP